MKILVTGGAGYIGGFMVKKLLERGDEVVVVDSLERGNKETVDPRVTFIQGNLLDKNFVSDLFVTHTFDAVMHFAAYIAVNESVANPGVYFENNVMTTLNLLENMHKKNISNFIFSSTGTVYGKPQILPMPETHIKNPENPYAESKLMIEKVLHWYFEAYKLSYAVLRYFNAAGAALDGSLGENHNPETHLIPKAIEAALQNTEFHLYGNDYNTSDGSCVRDYIHVLDLVNAHVLTLEKLQQQPGEYTYNVGTGKGSTNKEVVEMVKKISARDFPVVMKERRPGDVEATVADVTKIQQELGFIPQYSDLETIITSAWKWHSTHTA